MAIVLAKYICKIQLSTQCVYLIVKLKEICKNEQHFATFLSIRAQKRNSFETDMGKRLITGTELSGACTKPHSVPNIY